MSVVEIDQIRIYNKETGEPMMKGLMDPRMGCNGRNFECMTCEGDDLECPGHFGHIQLS